MKKIIFKKLFKDILIFFFFACFAISLIVWVIQAVNFLDFVSEDGHSFKVYFLYTFLNFPKIISKILPFIFFITLFYILVIYEEKNELLIFWTNGISKKEFLQNINKLSLLFVIFQLFLTTYIVPLTQDNARSYIRNSNIDFFPSLIKEQRFIDTVSDLTIYVGEKNEDGNFKNIFLKDKVDENKSQVIYAKEGKILSIDNQNFLKLIDGKIINLINNETTIFDFSETNFNLSGYSTKTTTTPKVQELNTTSLLNCAFNFYGKNKIFKNDDYECFPDFYKHIQQELLKRIYLPIYLPIIALIAASLIIHNKDYINYMSFRFKLFIVGVLTIVISEISIRYAALNIKSTLAFLIIPVLIYLIGYIFFTNKLKYKTNN